MATPTLKRPIRRRLAAFDSPRSRRPWFIEIDPEGNISVWPRRLKSESLHVETIFLHGAKLRRQREQLAKLKAKGKSYVSRR